MQKTMQGFWVDSVFERKEEIESSMMTLGKHFYLPPSL